MYIQYIQGLFQSRLGTADYALVSSRYEIALVVSVQVAAHFNFLLVIDSLTMITVCRMFIR
jgi:hypothetical protein